MSAPTDDRVWIETIGRRGEVRTRQAVTSWPCRIGRGYDMDAILDDPHVAILHAVLDRNADGSIAIRDAGTINGVQAGQPGKRLARLPADAQRALGGDEVVRLGHTLLRVRRADHPLAPELPIRDSWSRRPWVVIALVAVFLALMAVERWTGNWEGDAKDVFSDTLGYVFTLTAWVAAWGIVGRIVGGAALLAPHAAFSSLAAIGVTLLHAAIKAMTFALGLESRPEWLVLIASTAVFAWLLFAQLALVARLSRRNRIGYAILASCCFFGTVWATDWLKEDKHENMKYQELVYPAPLLLTPGAPTAEFMDEARRLMRHD